MATYSLTLRQEKGSKLTIQEMDNNWRYLDNKQSGSSNVPTIAFYKDNVGIGSASGLNIIEGTGGVDISGTNNPTLNRVDYTMNAFGGDSLSTRDAVTKESIIKRTFDSTVNITTLEIPASFMTESFTGSFNPGDLVETRFGESTGTILSVETLVIPNQTTFTVFYISGFSGSLLSGETRLNNLTVTGNTDDGQLMADFSGLTTGLLAGTFDITTVFTQTSTGIIGTKTGDSYVYNITSGTPQSNNIIFATDAAFGQLFFIRSVTSTPISTTITTGYVTLDDIGQSLPGSGVLATSGSDKVFAGVYDATSIGGKNKSFGVVSTINSQDSAYFFPVADGAAGQALITDGAGNVSFQDVSKIKSVKVTVSSADLLALVNGSIPYELIPSPGSGKFINVVSSSCYLNFNTTPYDFNGNLSIGTTNSIGTYSGKDGGEITTSPYDMINCSQSTFSVINGMVGGKISNNPLWLHKGTATTVTQGDSDLNIYITYEILDL